jgi:hypothetical protein
MLNLILFLITCFVIVIFFFLFLPFAVFVIDIVGASFGQSKLKPNYELHIENQLVIDSIEDSEGDGLMMFEDSMFPPEEDND